MSPSRSYEGSPLDLTWQGIHERPSLDKDAEDTVYATDPEPEGEEQSENVPVPEKPDEPIRPDRDGQTTLGDWGRSA